jgi:hypothetical protein
VRHSERVKRALPIALVVCALTSACAHETQRRPADVSNAPPPSTSPLPLALPDTAFQSDDDGPPVRTASSSPSSPRSRFDTRRIGARDDDASTAPRFHGAPVDLDLKGADVANVFRLLADVGHVNIVVAGEVTGTVTLKLTHVPWDQALDLVARLRGLDLERDGNVIMVRPRGAHAGDDGRARAQSEFAAAPAISDP